ncbi:MAG: hypothetical protein Q7S34_01255, partial [bacterium]|nr:hypothetical protein [bacterium]
MKTMELDERRVFGPRSTLQPPYFPKREIDLCKKEFERFAGKLNRGDIAFLKKALIHGKVNGSHSRIDLVGTIAKRRGMSQEALADLLGFNCDARENDLYYWFLQIGGYKTVRFQ